MKISSLVPFLSISFLIVFTQSLSGKTSIKYNDTVTVIELNKKGFENRLIDPEKTIKFASRAMKLGKALKYENGIAESYRVLGVGNYYLNKNETAIENYLNALTYFKKNKNVEGEAKVYNNIGNLYREIDYDKSLENFQKSLALALKLNIKDLIAGLYMNLGTVYLRKNEYDQALSNYQNSLAIFTKLDNTIGITQSMQNLGLVYFQLNQLDKSEELLINARSKARENKLNNSIAGIDLTLSSIYISKENFKQAEKTIKEGALFARLVKSPKLEYDYMLTSYELENKRKNYERALYYLQIVYKQDSITYKGNISDKISLLEAQHRQLEKQRANELTIARSKYSQILFWASSLVALLSFFVIFLLIKNVKKSKLINSELTRLNQEVSQQKDDLDRTNQNLEELIEERTMDLKNKNKKLSEYSSHLSHQIRSPVATLKGLMLLENENLIDKQEFIEQMGKCINDLDDKIININENLNNPGRSSLIFDD
ncbi:tetratricopeptide repeat protein [Daejeonella sp.]|uniref:tetratricopeptide repeat protein n=1 Tax=Daejeonella sp. TaxID=2805397 RepID=UPI0030BF19CC